MILSTDETDDHHCAMANHDLLEAAEEGDVTAVASLPLFCPEVSGRPLENIVHC